MGLMYGPTDNFISADELAAIPTPQPAGRFHQPVGFGDFIELVKHRMARAGIDIHQEEYITTADKQTFFGTMRIGLDGFEIDGVELTLGIRGSHNQKVPHGICLGNRVIVCSNLMFNGDLANVSTKQTTNVWQRLPGMVSQAISQLPQVAQREAGRVDAYKQFDMRPRWGDAALVELFRRGALSGAQLARATDEWDAPSFGEHAEDGYTAWRLLNAVTEVQKPTGSVVNMDTVRHRTSIASAFIDEVVGF